MQLYNWEILALLSSKWLAHKASYFGTVKNKKLINKTFNNLNDRYIYYDNKINLI